jgi:5-methylthioadenosine/S-adenosylhomocysteine deaminase
VTEILSADWVLPVEGAPIEDGAVAIEAGRIAAVGTRTELGRGRHFPEAAILPGFVNAHTHLEYAVYGGFGDGLGDFGEWIALHIERKARIGWDDHVAIARAGAAACLASGVTMVGDCSYSGAAAVACADLGLRGTVYLEVFGTDPGSALERFAAARERVGDAFSDRVGPGISPHAPYSTGIDVYRACAETGLPLATHLSESASELAYLRDGSGPWAGMPLFVKPIGTTGPRLLAEHGLLGPRVLAAHCVHVDEDEIELLAASAAAVVHCPRSNGLLGCGVAPLAALRRAGATVALGTDSPASAPSFDLFEELRAAVAGSRAREQRADALSGSEALELATLKGARALGLEADVGSIVPGKRADLTVVSMEGSSYLPWEDPAGAVVFGGAPERVITTLVDGEARYERGGTEWHELLRKAASARSRLLATPRSARAVVS